MALTTQQMQDIMVELSLDVPADKSKVKGADADAFRAKVGPEIADMRARGVDMQFAPEMLDPDFEGKTPSP